MEWIYHIFGEGKDLTALQMSARAFVMFFLTLLFIRIGGARAFGKKSPFDSTIVIFLGSVVAQGIAGVSPFGATVAASLVLVLVHRVLAWMMIKNKGVESFIKGKHLLLYQNGKIVSENFAKAGMSEDDLYESLRLEMQTESLEKIERAYMENDGRISFIVKDK